MRLKNKLYLPLFCLAIVVSSCENDAQRKQRLAEEEEHRIELEEKRKAVEAERAFQFEQDRIEREKRQEEERIAREARLEKERQERAIYDKYINNSLHTGETPYSYCFGGNRGCTEWGCAGISVKTPYNSDVMVTIKKNDKVVRHAYIKAGSTYKFEFPNGIYQAFFYYGKGWNPNKVMKELDCGVLRGGFIANESFSKDNPQKLDNAVLSYELILQQNGNFSTKPSNSNEAF
jgi:hypothetical protein